MDYHKLILILSIILIIYILIMTIANIGLFKKENIKPGYAFIPFYGLYLYLNIGSLPFFPVLIPGINIIYMFVSSYVIARQYKQNKSIRILAMFFPIIVIPYIAFNKKIENKNKVYDQTYLKNRESVDILENELIKEAAMVSDDTSVIDVVNPNIDTNYQSHTDQILAGVEENTTGYDEIVYDENENTLMEAKTEVPKYEEFDEIVDDDVIKDESLSISNIDNLEENIIDDAKVTKDVTTDIKDYKEVGPTDEAIAFGGEKKVEIDATKTKNDQLVCPRCGSSLVGNTGYCPGCGAKL